MLRTAELCEMLYAGVISRNKETDRTAVTADIHPNLSIAAGTRDCSRGETGKKIPNYSIERIPITSGAPTLAAQWGRWL